jgi:hypothetical protein
MWKRWGSPPDNSGQYSSGFEEEFRNSVERRQKNDSPEISLFFKDIEDELVSDPGEQLGKVLNFKKKITEEKIVLFENFDSIQDFEEKFSRCLSKYVNDLHAAERNKRVIETQENLRNKGTLLDSADTISGTADDSPFSANGVKFLRGLILDGGDNNGKDKIDSLDVARFRLLSCLIGSSANDAEVLGVHDANIIYANRLDTALDILENIGLVNSALHHFSAENIPLWYWLSSVENKIASELAICSRYGLDKKRIGALNAMLLVSTIYYLGRFRVEELLNMSIPDKLLINLVLNFSDKEIRNIDDSIIMSVFKNKNIKVRKAFLLKCIKSLPKNRIGKLLKDYFDLDGQRYYNVIYWLDLGVSLPSGVSRLAAQRAIVAGI